MSMRSSVNPFFQVTKFKKEIQSISFDVMTELKYNTKNK